MKDIWSYQSVPVDALPADNLATDIWLIVYSSDNTSILPKLVLGSFVSVFRSQVLYQFFVERCEQASTSPKLTTKDKIKK